MRYIDNTFLNLPVGWEERSARATRQLDLGERDIDQLSEVWRDLKACLAEASFRRCWYCESIINRSDNAVDHYRPKGRVKSCSLSNDGKKLSVLEINPVHDGYKWRAFSRENFRYSCDFCNEYRKDLEGSSGGKWNYFPLIREDRRAYNAGQERFEVPVILDPCKALDWLLLSYDVNGRPFSAHPPGSEEDIKVRLSIRLLHLDQEGLNEARRQCWSLVRPIVERAKEWFLEKMSDNPEADYRFQDELRQLKQWLNPQNPAAYVGFVRYKLRNDKDREIHPWLSLLAGGNE